MDALSPYIGLSLGEVNIGKILVGSTHIAVKHNLQVPRELMLLFRAMVTVESLGKKLDPTFNLLLVGTRLAKQSITSRYSKERMLKDLIVVGRDLHELVEVTPRLFKRFLRKWSQSHFAFETRSRDVATLGLSVKQLASSLLICTFAACLLAIGLTLIILNLGPSIGGLPLWGAVSCFTGVGAILLELWFLRKHS
jgi:ubiquinone biosynthesis protein